MAENSKTRAEENAVEVQQMIDELVKNANEALAEYIKMDQAQVDRAVHAMTLAGLDKHMMLAHMAVEETGRGVIEDKVIKNIFATEYIWHSIEHQKTVGVIDENDMEGYIEVAEPVGVVAGVTPVTNPTSTTMFKSLICAKTRNPIIFGFHPSAQKCSVEAARVMRDAAVAAGAPNYCVQWIEHPSIAATNALMNHPGISLILATGGSSMVKAAYSAGKPALGVGPGNVPCYINKNVNVGRACTDLILSKTFDNGMICASEQAVIVDKEISGQFEKIMTDNSCYFLRDDEIEKVSTPTWWANPRTGSPQTRAFRCRRIRSFSSRGFLIPPGRTRCRLRSSRRCLHTLCAKMPTRGSNMPKRCWSLAGWDTRRSSIRTTRRCACATPRR
jgi:acetaldehyde dehydrogenase/alcohol dehydrogenase